MKSPKKTPPKPIVKAPEYTCEDCGHGEYDMKFENLNVTDRHPTLIICPHTPDRKRLRTEKSCNLFIPKQQS